MGEAVRERERERERERVCQLLYPLSHFLQALELEHRDLHRANVLVSTTEQKQFYYRLEGREFIVPSHGVKATIVDYTLSRIKQGILERLALQVKL